MCPKRSERMRAKRRADEAHGPRSRSRVLAAVQIAIFPKARRRPEARRGYTITGDRLISGFVFLSFYAQPLHCVKQTTILGRDVCREAACACTAQPITML